MRKGRNEAATTPLTPSRASKLSSLDQVSRQQVEGSMDVFKVMLLNCFVKLPRLSELGTDDGRSADRNSTAAWQQNSLPSSMFSVERLASFACEVACSWSCIGKLSARHELKRRGQNETPSGPDFAGLGAKQAPGSTLAMAPR